MYEVSKETKTNSTSVSLNSALQRFIINHMRPSAQKRLDVSHLRLLADYIQNFKGCLCLYLCRLCYAYRTSVKQALSLLRYARKNARLAR